MSGPRKWWWNDPNFFASLPKALLLAGVINVIQFMLGKSCAIHFLKSSIKRKGKWSFVYFWWRFLSLIYLFSFMCSIWKLTCNCIFVIRYNPSPTSTSDLSWLRLIYFRVICHALWVALCLNINHFNSNSQPIPKWT